MENQNLAQGVKELRKRKALSQDELAKSAGISLRTVQRVENGETIPTGETLKRIAVVLEVAPDELLAFTSEKEVPKIVLKTKHEYIHFFNDKLVFSKTPEINLVEDYNKSVSYVFRTLMVFFVSIPIFAIMTFIFYNMQNIEMVFYSGSFCFFFLVMAFFTMLFTSGKPVINIDSIAEIKIKNNLFQNNIVIYFVESGRIKGRGLIVEKDQIDNIVNGFLSVQLIEEKDIKDNKKDSKKIIIFLIFGFIFYLFYKHNNPNGMMYFNGIIIAIVTLITIIKMMKNTVFIRNRIISKICFREERN